jgi:hypothetical protein
VQLVPGLALLLLLSDDAVQRCMSGTAGAVLQFKVYMGHCRLQDPEFTDLELPGLHVQQHSEGHTLLGVCAGVIEKEAASTPQHLPSLNGLLHVGQPL